MSVEIPIEPHHIYIAILKRNCKPSYLNGPSGPVLFLTAPDGQRVLISLSNYTAFVL